MPESRIPRTGEGSLPLMELEAQPPQPQEIMRVVELPAEVDASKVNATLKDGVLTIELPKTPQAKRVRIEAKTA